MAVRPCLVQDEINQDDHELALDVGISNSLALIAFHQADVARGVLHEERLHAPAAANAARTIPCRLRIAHR